MTFPAPAVLSLEVSGYPLGQDSFLWLERISDRQTLTLRPDADPGPAWERYEFSIPRTWQGKSVRLIAASGMSKSDSFVGFTNPDFRPLRTTGEAANLFLHALLSWISLFLPGYCFALLLIQKGWTDPILLGCSVLAAIGTWGYLTFWIWFASPGAGRLSGIILLLVCLIYLAIAMQKLDRPKWLRFRCLMMPALLTGALAMLVLSTGFLYGGFGDPFYAAAHRFTHSLPADNQVPYLFSTALARGTIPKPLAGDWLSSDRPPLQTGIYLAQYSLSRGRIGYTSASVLCQCLWIYALLLLLESFALPRKLISLALLACTLSGVVFLNSFYVWPKLLAAAYTCAFLLFFLPRGYRMQLNKGAAVAVLAGALLALAMLSHGGSLFAFVGLGSTIVLLREFPGGRSCGLLVITAALFYLPWMGYQKFFDPPGNLLLKMHLAGVATPDGRSFLAALRDAYRPLTFQQWFAAKANDAGVIIGSPKIYWRDMLRLAPLIRNPAARYEAARDLRVQNFFFLLPCVGPFVLGPVVALLTACLKEGNEVMKIAGRLWLFAGFTIISWCLILFSPASTVIHQGSYAVVLIALCASLLAGWAVSPKLAELLVFAFVSLNVWLYLVCMRPPPTTGAVNSGVLRVPLAVLACLSLVSIVLLLGRFSVGTRFLGPERKSCSYTSTPG